MVKKSLSDTINSLCSKLSLGLPQTIIPITNIESEVLYYRVTTSKSIYLIEKFNYDKEQIKELKNKIRVGEELKTTANIVSPLVYQDKKLIKHKGSHYIVFDIKELTLQQKEEMTKEKIKKIANLLAKIHKSDITSDIPSYYHKVEMDFDKLLNKLKKTKSSTYKLVYDNIFTLKDIVYKCNNSLQYLERNLTLDIGNYEINKILWKKEEPFIYDLSSVTFINPASSVCTTSFYYSLENNELNYDYYKLFMKEYIKEYGLLKVDYKDSLYVGLINELDRIDRISQKLNFISNKIEIDQINKHVTELLIYYNNINKMNETYLKIISKNNKN